MNNAPQTPNLTLGPLLFYWPSDKWQDFYYRIADEAPINTVYLGDVMCPKRYRATEKARHNAIERLQKAGKNVVQSSMLIVTNDKDNDLIEKITSSKDLLVEANEMTAVSKLKGKTFHIGPFVNVYNELTLKSLVSQGATHFCLPFEINGETIRVLTYHAEKNNVTTEVMVYGRAPLAIASRCYHARSYGRESQGCKLVCENDPDGKSVETMDNQDFLVINGRQTLTHTCTNLIKEIPEMIESGVSSFRLSPHSCDMVSVANIFNDVICKKTDTESAFSKLKKFNLDSEFSNGFYHGKAGHEWIKVA